MSRFYKTSSSNPVDWAYQLPYQEMMQGVLAKTQQQENMMNYADKISAMGEDVRYMKQDQTRALEAVDWLNRGVEQFQNVDLTDTSNLNKLRSFAKEAARRWGRSGDVGAIMSNYDASQKFLKDLSENKNLTQDDKNAAMNYYFNNYKGIGDVNPYGGQYNPFESRMISDHIDMQTEWNAIAKDIENDKVTQSGSSPANLYITDWKKYRDLPNAERIKMVWEGFKNRPEVVSYLKDRTSIGMYDESKLPDYLNTVFRGGIGQIGTEIIDESKLRSDATQLALRKEDLEGSVNPYLTITEQTNLTGQANYTGSIDGLFPDNTIAANKAIIIPKVKPIGDADSTEMYLMQLYAMGNPKDKKGFKKINTQTARYNNEFNSLIESVARDRGIYVEDLEERIMSFYNALTDDQKKGYGELGALQLQGNELFNVNTGGGATFRNIGGHNFVDIVGSSKVNDAFGGIATDKLETINGYFGEEVFTLKPGEKGTEVFANISVQKDPTEADMINMNKSFGLGHTMQRQQQFIEATGKYARRDAYNREGTNSGLIPYNGEYYTEQELLNANFTKEQINGMKGLLDKSVRRKDNSANIEKMPSTNSPMGMSYSDWLKQNNKN